MQTSRHTRHQQIFCLPSLELMNNKMLHLFPQVAFTCLARFSWFLGPVIIQQRTLTSLYNLLATVASSMLWNSSFSEWDPRSTVGPAIYSISRLEWGSVKVIISGDNATYATVNPIAKPVNSATKKCLLNTGLKKKNNTKKKLYLIYLFVLHFF